MLKSFYIVTQKYLPIFLFLLVSKNLLANATAVPQSVPPAAPAVPAPASEQKIQAPLSPQEMLAYYQVMKQWAETTNFAKNGAEIATNKLKLELDADPKYAKVASPEFIADMEQFFYELFISQETMVELTKLYSQYFTLSEMQQLIAFYKTPLGQKLVKTNSELMTKSQIISTDLLRKNQKKYMELVGKYIKSVQQGNMKRRE